MNKLIIMCGLIGSGKTTWVQNYLDMFPSTLVVSKDDIRRMLHGGKYVFNENLEALVELTVINLLRSASYYPGNIILDECHLTEESREVTTSRLKTIVYFPPKDKDWHLERVQKRGYSRDEWEAVYDKMIAKLEPPTEDECDELIIVED